ncbi:MAG TPA: hypothetical protein PKL84_13810, partial [Candidatus Hydrogenedentes bacterium]|nr:hypothetical protein [Candidatus Hydrogenedentota bacterium]
MNIDSAVQGNNARVNIMRGEWLLILCAATIASVAGAETLTLTIVGEGTTIPEAGVHEFESGQTVFLSANPAPGWRFDHWEGDLTGTQSSLVPLVMDADKNVTAVFVELANYTLTIAIVGNGVTSPPAGSHEYIGGQTAMLSATPDPGWAFDHWEGDLTGTDPYHQFLLMDADKEVTAVFSPQAHTLTMSVEGYGATLPPVGETGFLDGRVTQVRAAILSMDWYFDHWEGDLAGSNNPESLLMDSDKAVTAVFATTAVSFNLTTFVQGNGSVDPPGSTSHAPGAEVVLTATPDEGWEFIEWLGDVTGSENPATVTMYYDMTVTAVFQELGMQYTLTTTAVGGGDIDPPGETYHDPGSTVILTATPHVGWEFVEWQGAVTGSENPTSLLMDGNKIVAALFSELPTRTVTMTIVGSGTTTPPIGTTTHPGGAEITVSATPAAGWFFDHWEGDLTGSENPTTIVLDVDKAITAVFVQVMHTLTTEVVGNGTITPAGVTNHAQGATVRIVAIPEEEWAFDHWEGD